MGVFILLATQRKRVLQLFTTMKCTKLFLLALLAHHHHYTTMALSTQVGDDVGTTCQWTDPEGKTVDLSSMTKSGPDFYSHTEGNFIFRLNLCGEVDSSSCSNHDAAAVQFTKDDDKCVSVLASATQPPSSWSKLQPPHDGFALTFSGGDAGCSEAPFTRTMTYDMVCDDTLQEAELLSVVENPTCVYTAIWKINCSAPSPGMTFAVKFCLIFGFVFILYIGIACYLERQDSGETSIPETHKEYWREFVALALEGCALSYETTKEFAASKGFFPFGAAAGTEGGSSKSGYDAVPTIEKGGGASYGSGAGGNLDGEREPDFGDENL